MKNLMSLSIVSICLIIFIGCAGMQYGTGVGHLKQQNYKDAIDSFNTVLEKNPEYPNAHTQLGIAYYKTGRYEQAISELKTARKLQDSDKRARLFLGMAYLRHGKMGDSINEWDSYLEMFPSDNVTEILRKNIVVLKSGKVLPGTADLMTDSIENVITQEDKILDTDYYYRVRSFGYRHSYLHHHGHHHGHHHPCD
jgi:tetratricopeptide (TPR) repeat protein